PAVLDRRGLLGDAARTEPGGPEAGRLRSGGTAQHRARDALPARRRADRPRRRRADPRGMRAEPANRRARHVPRDVRARDRAAMSTFRVAVVGTAYLGGFHAQKYAALPLAELVGVCDIDEQAGRAAAEAVDARYFPNHRDLVGRIDAVTIAATTSAHFEL